MDGESPPVTVTAAERAKRWREANRQAHGVMRRSEYVESVKLDPEEKRARKKASADRRKALNPESYLARARQHSIKWREANIETARKLERDKAQRAYRENPDKFRKRISEWAKSNPEKKLAVNVRRRARELGAEGSFTAADVALIRARQGDLCRYCSTPLNGAGHLDHRVPLAREGSNWPSNLQWLCQPCNTQKRDSDPDGFERKIGFICQDAGVSEVLRAA